MKRAVKSNPVLGRLVFGVCAIVVLVLLAAAVVPGKLKSKLMHGCLPNVELRGNIGWVEVATALWVTRHHEAPEEKCERIVERLVDGKRTLTVVTRVKMFEFAKTPSGFWKLESAGFYISEPIRPAQSTNSGVHELKEN